MGNLREPRVGVNVTPRLLSDAVSRVLIDQGLEVVVRPDERAVEECDVVVTSQMCPPEEPGVIVTVLPGRREAGGGSASQPASAVPARVRTLNELVTAIRVFIDVLPWY